MSKELKLQAIKYFLNEVLNKDYPIEVRVDEMLRVGKKTCNGFPEWSDYWGVALKPIDDISWHEFNDLLKEIY